MRKSTTLLFLITAFTFSATRTNAQDGALDTSFSQNGIAYHPQFNIRNSHPIGVQKMLVMPDSTLLLSCPAILEPDIAPGLAKFGYVFCRMDKRGKVLDTVQQGSSFFPYSGFRFVSAPNGLQADGSGPRGLDLLPNGQVLLTTGVLEANNHQAQTTLKFNYPSMTLDTTYGINGMGQLWEGYQPYTDQLAERTAVAPDGSTYTASSKTDINGDSLYAYIIKRKPNGMRDSSWQTNGVYRFVPQNGAIIHDIHVAANGAIYSSGIIKDPAKLYHAFVMKQLPNGTPDMTYGTNGMALEEYISDNMILNDDGSTYMVGQRPWANQSSYVAKFKPNGKADSSFGGNGRIQLQENDTSYQISSIVKQRDGKLVVSGRQIVLFQDSVSVDFSSGIFSCRILPNGKFDTTFGRRGMIIYYIMPEVMPSVPLYPHIKRWANCMAIQKDGKILLGCQTIFSSATVGEMAVLRLLNHDNMPVTGIPAVTANDIALRVAPVPAGNLLHLQYTLATEDKLKVLLTDISGRVVLSLQPEQQVKGAHTTDLHLPPLPAGIYILQLNGTKNKGEQRVIIR